MRPKSDIVVGDFSVSSNRTRTADDVILTSLWQVTVYAAFQRAKIYVKKATSEDKKELKRCLRSAIVKLAPRYREAVADQEHMKGIARIKAKIDRQWAHAVGKRGISIGVVQKALNLYLKLLWCLGRASEPPHCPVDSVIIATLPTLDRVPWTRIRSIDDYEKLISKLRNLAEKEGLSLAAWELVAYEKLSARSEKLMNSSRKRQKRAA
jgi:hypothetical protein